MKFIIVDSIKGGCGKSIEAIAAATRIIMDGIQDDGDFVAPDEKNTPYNENLEEKVCIIDFDILGTSIEQMLLGGSKIRENADGHDKNYAQVYLNDLVYDSKNMNKKIETPLDITLNRGKPKGISIIMSSPYDEDRQKFRISSDSNYLMHVMPTHFRGVIKRLIEKLSECGFKTVIFDMPPNSDPYTDTIFELLLSEREDDLIDKVELEIVSNCDRAHVKANMDWLSALCKGRSNKRRPFNHINFILNDCTGIYNDNKDELRLIAQNVANTITNELSKSLHKKEISVHFKEYKAEIARYFAYESKTSKASSTLDFSDCGYWYLINPAQ